jgi:hypothetical protein
MIWVLVAASRCAFKTVDRIDQQAFLDPYSKAAFAEIYDRKNGICEPFHRTIQEEFRATAFARSRTPAWRNCRPT